VGNLLIFMVVEPPPPSSLVDRATHHEEPLTVAVVLVEPPAPSTIDFLKPQLVERERDLGFGEESQIHARNGREN
jgi:hypothetical protein